MIVVIAMLGMLLLGVSFLYGVAIAAAVTVAFTVLAALTLLPALLSLFGNGVLRRRERRAIREHRLASSDESPAWSRWASILERHPAAFAMVATSVLILIAIPFFSMRLGSTDAGADPTSTTTHKAYDLLAQGSDPGTTARSSSSRKMSPPRNAPSSSVSRTPSPPLPGVVGVTRTEFFPGSDGQPGVAIAQAYPRGSPQSASTSDLLTELRENVIPQVTRADLADRARRWRDRDLRRLQRRADDQAAAVRRDRRADVVRAADDGLPQHRRAAVAALMNLLATAARSASSRPCSSSAGAAR